jgi:hypothetical protein
MGKSATSVQLLLAGTIIISLFRQAVLDKRFQDRWISDANLVTALKSHYCIDVNAWDFTTAEFNRAITNDKAYKASSSFWEDFKTSNVHNAFRRQYKPRLVARKDNPMDTTGNPVGKRVTMYMYYFANPAANENQRVPKMVIEGSALPGFLIKNPFTLGKAGARKTKRPSNQLLDTFMGHRHAEKVLAETNLENSDKLVDINLSKLTDFWQSGIARNLFAPFDNESADVAVERHIEKLTRATGTASSWKKVLNWGGDTKMESLTEHQTYDIRLRCEYLVY